jgi:flavin-dependent dehydrogenase
MSEKQWDAVIVGARCAGSALATYLRRKGASVVVLEAARLHTDHVVSTHTVHPCGMDLLDELGVADAVRAKCGSVRTVRIQVGRGVADINTEGRGESCPRRTTLDSLLQDAAIGAGAEVLEDTRVTELLREGDRVVGVRAQRNGEKLEFRGTITVGADGRHSTIANLVGAEEYLEYDWPRGAYWAYWELPPAWKSDAYPFDFMVQAVGTQRRFIFPTDDGQVLLATAPLRETLEGWRGRHQEAYIEDLRSDPTFGPLVEDGKQLTEVRGTLKEHFYFRRAVGPGWALAGDAGHHKDPVGGWGISEALEQAKQLSEAILDGSDSAMQRYWRGRDVSALPRYRIAEDRGAPTMSPVFEVVIDKVGKDPELGKYIAGEFEFEVNPYELIPVSVVMKAVIGQVARGRLGLLPAFLKQGRRISSVQRELKERQRLLEAIPAATPAAVPVAATAH